VPGTGVLLCSTCHNVYSNMAHWMFLTPEFQMSVVLVSQPLVLIIALWGMSPPRASSDSETLALPPSRTWDMSPPRASSDSETLSLPSRT
jgi:hypothetical protein